MRSSTQPSRPVYWLFCSAMSFPAQALESSPITTTVSDTYLCGGTGRLSGAGLFLNTRPARSNVEPWQGQTKPGSAPSCAFEPAAYGPDGEHPRWVQTPTVMRN